MSAKHILQAITTKYLAPTNFKGARVKAECAAGAIVVNWDHDLNPEQMHERAAMALVKKVGWQNIIEGGHMKDGRYCWILKGSK